MVLESAVENYLLDRVANCGGIALKVTTLGRRGFFDRLVVLPGGRILFVEVKRPKGGKVAAHQRARHALFRTLGCEVRLVKTLADVDLLLAADVPAGVQNPLHEMR
jgi:hypothetical protein